MLFSRTCSFAMRTIKLTLAYDGSAYAGWQFQPNVPTLQAAVESVIAKITGETLRVTGSGRTDSGVHALGQVVSFSTESQLEPQVLQRAMNAFLPDDIVVLEVADAPERFHAIRDAVRKRYRYVIDDARLPDVFSRAYSWKIWKPLDVAAMQRAASALIGTHDFSSFETSGSPRPTSIRTLFEITVERLPAEQGGKIYIEVEADGFLYNMVRTIAGSLMLVGKGVKAETWLAEVLEARDRCAAGPTAPPQGLFLLKVEYSSPGSDAADRDEESESAIRNAESAIQ